MPKFLYPQIPDSFEQVYFDGLGSECIFIFRDLFIDDNVHLSADELLSILENETLLEESEILYQRDLFIDKLREREKGWDIKISDFILDNYKTTQLFYDPNHPTGTVLKFITEKILDILGIETKLYWNNIYELDDKEIPIYETVRKALGLTYHIDVMRKSSGAKMSDIEMTKREYIRQYKLWNYSHFQNNHKNIIVYDDK